MSSLQYDFDDVEVQLERDMRVRRFSVIMQYTGPTLVDVNEVVTNDLIERRTTPIQVVELIYKQAHSCQYAQ